MILGRVTSSVVSTQKNPELRGNRILLVQPVSPKLEPKGPPLLALDVSDAGEGDLVLVNREGGGARIIFKNDKIPLQAVVVGVVDRVDYRPGEAGKMPFPRA